MLLLSSSMSLLIGSILTSLVVTSLDLLLWCQLRAGLPIPGPRGRQKQFKESVLQYHSEYIWTANTNTHIQYIINMASYTTYNRVASPFARICVISDNQIRIMILLWAYSRFLFIFLKSPKRFRKCNVFLRLIPLIRDEYEQGFRDHWMWTLCSWWQVFLH